MENVRRYAIYWAPAPGPLAAFAAAWLGWDPAAGTGVAHPDLPGLPLPVAELTQTPQKYGFHGTLKAPFRLAEGATRAGLEDAVAAFAARTAPVALPGLRLARIDRFLALVPEGDAAGLNALAARIVADLDGFRAPLTPEDLARRKADALPPRQRALLERWGYPDVMDDFRFHLTLTGGFEAAVLDGVRDRLDPLLAPLLPRPFTVEAVCLFGEAQDGRFHLLHRYTLSG